MSQMESDRGNDILLLQQVEEGSKRAFNMLFEKYWEKTYSDAYRRLKNQDDAKDIVQEIFTHIWINRGKVHIEDLQAYLYVAVRNKVFKYFTRKKLTNPFLDILNNVPEKNSTADAQLLWKEFTQSYEALLESLPPKRQTIFRLRYLDDLATKDIAMQLGISRKTVQNQLGKAVETLKVSLLRILIIAFTLLSNSHVDIFGNDL